MEWIIQTLDNKTTKVGLLCDSPSANYLGATDKPLLFSLTKNGNFISIESKNNEKNCNLVIARRLSDTEYILIQTCIILLNDINIFGFEGTNLTLLTPENQLLYLSLSDSPNCSTPHLLFVKKDLANVTKTSFANPVVPIIPAPINEPVSSGLGAGWIFLIIVLSLLGLFLLIWLISLLFPKRKRSYGDKKQYFDAVLLESYDKNRWPWQR